MKKLANIKEEKFLTIVREEYQEAKRILKPLLNQWHFSAVKFRWDLKNAKRGGWCNYSRKEIAMNVKYKEVGEETWSEEMFRLTLRHEIAHLIYHNHGAMFLRALELLKGHRYVGQPAYTREQKVKPTK